MKVLDALLVFTCNKQDLDEEEEIKKWEETEAKLDDNNHICIYEIETIDGEIINVTIQATKEVK